MERYRHGRLRGKPSLRHMEPEHLDLPPRGAFPSRSGNRATLRLHLSQQGFARDWRSCPRVSCVRSRAEVQGGEDSLWSLGSLAVTRCDPRSHMPERRSRTTVAVMGRKFRFGRLASRTRAAKNPTVEEPLERLRDEVALADEVRAGKAVVPPSLFGHLSKFFRTDFADNPLRIRVEHVFIWPAEPGTRMPANLKPGSEWALLGRTGDTLILHGVSPMQTETVRVPAGLVVLRSK